MATASHGSIENWRPKKKKKSRKNKDEITMRLCLTSQNSKYSFDKKIRIPLRTIKHNGDCPFIYFLGALCSLSSFQCFFFSSTTISFLEKLFFIFHLECNCNNNSENTLSHIRRKYCI